MIGVGGEELQGCHQSGLCFVFTYRPMRERCWRACLQIGDVRPYRSQSAGASYTASAAFSPHGQSGPAPPRPVPPLRPRPRPAAGLRGWSGGRAPGLVRLAPAAAVPSPQAADCPSRRPRSQPPFLGRGCLRRSERASRGYGRPEQKQVVHLTPILEVRKLRALEMKGILLQVCRLLRLYTCYGFNARSSKVPTIKQASAYRFDSHVHQSEVEMVISK
ncbi:hypothetical protein J1605_001725 [Eschrichtius robustus]|uniref:Uncharacterized protein n=1 Tax=Eschrichtius robustus TaxID=9764 RepID=A0AB34I3V7_ESCRO|nr:hypothetical protein J1605_001725 [Eschrichtius robustus]